MGRTSCLGICESEVLAVASANRLPMGPEIPVLSREAESVLAFMDLEAMGTAFSQNSWDVAEEVRILTDIARGRDSFGDTSNEIGPSERMAALEFLRKIAVGAARLAGHITDTREIHQLTREAEDGGVSIHAMQTTHISRLTQGARPASTVELLAGAQLQAPRTTSDGYSETASASTGQSEVPIDPPDGADPIDRTGRSAGSLGPGGTSQGSPTGPARSDPRGAEGLGLHGQADRSREIQAAGPPSGQGRPTVHALPEEPGGLLQESEQQSMALASSVGEAFLQGGRGPAGRDSGRHNVCEPTVGVLDDLPNQFQHSAGGRTPSRDGGRVGSSGDLPGPPPGSPAARGGI